MTSKGVEYDVLAKTRKASPEERADYHVDPLDRLPKTRKASPEERADYHVDPLDRLPKTRKASPEERAGYHVDPLDELAETHKASPEDMAPSTTDDEEASYDPLPLTQAHVESDAGEQVIKEVQRSQRLDIPPRTAPSAERTKSRGRHPALWVVLALLTALSALLVTQHWNGRQLKASEAARALKLTPPSLYHSALYRSGATSRAYELPISATLLISSPERAWVPGGWVELDPGAQGLRWDHYYSPMRGMIQAAGARALRSGSGDVRLLVALDRESPLSQLELASRATTAAQLINPKLPSELNLALYPFNAFGADHAQLLKLSLGPLERSATEGSALIIAWDGGSFKVDGQPFTRDMGAERLPLTSSPERLKRELSGRLERAPALGGRARLHLRLSAQLKLSQLTSLLDEVGARYQAELKERSTQPNLSGQLSLSLELIQGS